MRSFIAIAAIFAAVNAGGHEGHNEWDKKDHGMDHGDMHHGMDHGDMHHASDWDMDCMFGGSWECDSAVSLGASAAALAATMAVLM